MSFRKLGAEFILSFMALPWLIWVTVSIFTLDSADAVQETKLDQIRELLMEVRTDIKSIKEK